MVEERKCACGCGRDLPEAKGGRGRPRIYYNSTCRTRAKRDRELNARWVPALEHEVHLAEPDHVAEGSQAILELANLGGSFRRLSIEERNPRLAAGYERTYLGIGDLLAKNFPGWDR